MDISVVFFTVGYILRRAHWLSLDVVLGAMLAHIVAQKLPDGQGKVSWISTCLVGIAVFSIYAIDRFFDNKKSQTPLTLRHKFYSKHQKTIINIIVGFFIIGAILLFWMPIKVVVFGTITALLIALYLWGIYKYASTSSFYAWKEIIVAIAYTIGTWGTAYITKELISIELWFLIGLLLLIALQNLLLFSWFESFQLDEGNSLAIVFGTETTSKLIGWITVVITIVGIGIVLFTTYHYIVRTAIVLILMSIANFLLKQNKDSIITNERYRWLADGILIWWVWLL